jgi:hypothetical protein
MAVAATGAGDAREILQDPGVGLVAIDLRGTLIRTPRVTTLLPELDRHGVPPALAQSVQARFDVELRGPLQQRCDVLDWTRFAATSMASMLRSAWQPALDVEAVVTGFHGRYLRESRRLIEPAPLQRASSALAARCAIVADGPLRRETAVLAACFGTPRWMPPLISSECLGVNKLGAEFFVRLGDRWDKDVLIPRQAGCRGVLVGSGAEDAAWVQSLTSLVGLLDERLPCAA